MTPRRRSSPSRPGPGARCLARQLQAAFLSSLAAVRPETFDAGPPTLGHAVDTYFELYGERQAPSYRASLEFIFREFVKAAGDKPVEQVTDLDFKRYEKRLVGRELSATTVRSQMRQVSMLFTFCLRKDWLKQDPRLTYRMPKEELPDPNPFSDDEVRAFFEFVRRPARYRPTGWASMEWVGTGLLVLGLRPVELRGVRWEHVNFDNRFLFVAESHGAKVKQARQWQPIPAAVWPLFKEHRKESGFVWTAHHGAQITPHALGSMRETVKAALPEFSWKRFRKTYATIIATAGNDVSVVSRLLRHSASGRNTSVAERHYMGRSDALLREIVDEAFAPWAGVVAPGRAGGDAVAAGVAG